MLAAEHRQKYERTERSVQRSTEELKITKRVGKELNRYAIKLEKRRIVTKIIDWIPRRFKKTSMQNGGITQSWNGAGEVH